MGGVSRFPYASLNLGAHVEDDPAAVAENRRRLKVAAGLPAEPAWLTQVHGNCVRDLDRGEPVGGADGAVARQPGRVCAILTADCLPVLFASQNGDRVGAAHAGWRGLASGVLEATVAALGCAPGELLAWLGPAIGPLAFEVGAEVRDAFMSAPDAAAFVVRTAASAAAAPPFEAPPAWMPWSAVPPAESAAGAGETRGRYLADLYALARCRLARLGVTRVHGGGECTFTDASRYFSHRRDGRTGRLATLIWREAAQHR
jgi:YfiH family protein